MPVTVAIDELSIPDSAGAPGFADFATTIAIRNAIEEHALGPAALSLDPVEMLSVFQEQEHHQRRVFLAREDDEPVAFCRLEPLERRPRCDAALRRSRRAEWSVRSHAHRDGQCLPCDWFLLRTGPLPRTVSLFAWDCPRRSPESGTFHDDSRTVVSIARTRRRAHSSGSLSQVSQERRSLTSPKRGFLTQSA